MVPNTNEGDSRLVSASLAGDEDAFKKLLDKYLKPIYGFLYYLTKDATVAEDLAQETFIKAWKNLSKFDQSKSFKTWLFAITKNTALDFFKKKKTTPFAFFADEDGRNRLEDMPEDAIWPDEILVKKDLARELEGRLALLPEKYRVILTLHYKEDFTLTEIAEILGRPYNTIKAYHGRALAALKKTFLDL